MKLTAPSSFAAPSFAKHLETAICLWLIACVTGFVIVSRHWPMVGDVTYMHYVVFLMHHGMEPYRDIVDMNLPGSYMLEAAAMAVLGPGAAGWRIYDLLLLALASVSVLSILRPSGRLAGIFAAALFVLVHAQDGVIMSGERDFAAAVFLLASTALLFTALRGEPAKTSPLRLVFASGAVSGLALIIKPTLLPLAAALFLWMVWASRQRKANTLRLAAASIAGAVIPMAASVAFLIRHHAVAAFWSDLHSLIPYHASFGHRTFGYLVAHSISPLLPLLALWLVAAFLLRREAFNPERIALFLAAFGGLFSYVAQQKGFAYQRYPLLGFLVLLIAMDLATLIRRNGRVPRTVGWVGIAMGVVFATQFLVRCSHFDRFDEPRPLLADLNSLGVQPGQVQCMDTGGNCIDSLYAGRILQSTGFLYDCYMLDGTNPVALDLRRRFWQQMQLNPPRLIVVTDSLCYDVAPSYDKYSRWPEFQSFLDANYALARQSGPQQPVRYWSRSAVPFGYRIYAHR